MSKLISDIHVMVGTVEFKASSSFLQECEHKMQRNIIFPWFYIELILCLLYERNNIRPRILENRLLRKTTGLNVDD